MHRKGQESRAAAMLLEAQIRLAVRLRWRRYGHVLDAGNDASAVRAGCNMVVEGVEGRSPVSGEIGTFWH